jgi:hypothetical protein
MMTTVRITHLLTILRLCTDTMDTDTLDPGIIAITDTAITDLDIMVTTGEEDTVTMVVMDIGGKGSPLMG